MANRETGEEARAESAKSNSNQTRMNKYTE